MRMSHLFSQTLREIPAEADIASQQLLLRAGFVRQLAAGVFSYLPLARRSMTKIENIIREEMNAIGGQELSMPVVHPAELWKETGRWYQIDAEMGRFKDRSGRDLVLAMTHEEVVADLVRKEIRSYRQLPMLLYHIQTKWRDDPRPRAGLIRVREFTMKDSYSLDADWEGLESQYRAHYQAYFNIFHKCGIDVIAVRSDSGMMGGKLAHEFMFLNPIGEDTLLLCDACGYSANQQIAVMHKPRNLAETQLPLEKVATPESKTIEDLANLLNIPKSRTTKAVFLMATIPEGKEVYEKFIFAIIRGDLEVNETKLANAIKAQSLRPATEEEIRHTGAVPGYASPIGLKHDGKFLIVVDDLLPSAANLVAGANEEGFHFLNTNYGRDYPADYITDISSALDGDACPNCKNPLRAVRGVEVGNIFQLGTRYSEALGCYYIDQNGESKPVIMGSYGIGVGRLLACVAEACHDDSGLQWPISIAPYQVHLIKLVGKSKEAGIEFAAETSPAEISELIYRDLTSAGIELLYDDRDESPGVKFNDADLIGIPIRITVSERSLKQGGVECKLRMQTERSIIPVSEVVENTRQQIRALQQALEDRVILVPYK
jgi:prolyl-tRNA synthetase